MTIRNRSLLPSFAPGDGSSRPALLGRGLLLALALSALGGASLDAQEATPAQLQQQLRELQESFRQMQAEQARQIEALKQQIEALQQAQTRTATNEAIVSGVATAAATAPPAALPPPPPPPEAKPPWSPTAPITLVGNSKNYLNLSLDGLMAAGGSTADDIGSLELGGHDPQQNGFTLQNLELVLDGAVDPYFRARASVIYQIDSAGESNLEVEEAYAETTALPANLQIRAGQFLSEFGRLNPTHPHTWSFVDTSLVNGRFFGGDGLRNPGARLSWLTPTPFYSELFLGIQNSHGETAHSFRSDHEEELLFGRPAVERDVDSLGDLLFTPRYAVSFDLSETQTLLAGASAALGPNASGQATSTQIYGVDLYWKWKPAKTHGGFPFVAWQTEALWRQYDAGACDGSDPAQPDVLPAETLSDYGFYSQITYGFRKGWVAGLRGDWVSGNPGANEPDPDRDTRWRISPDLTWYPSEYTKIRVQYNYDDRANIGVDHSVWVQLEFLLGAHAAHKF